VVLLVAMSMFVLFVGLVAYGLFSLLKALFSKFDARIKRMVNAAEVAMDAFKYSDKP
jgi:hypothetical protein